MDVQQVTTYLNDSVNSYLIRATSTWPSIVSKACISINTVQWPVVNSFTTNYFVNDYASIRFVVNNIGYAIGSVVTWNVILHSYDWDTPYHSTSSLAGVILWKGYVPKSPLSITGIFHVPKAFDDTCWVDE